MVNEVFGIEIGEILRKFINMSGRKALRVDSSDDKVFIEFSDMTTINRLELGRDSVKYSLIDGSAVEEYVLCLTSRNVVNRLYIDGGIVHRKLDVDFPLLDEEDY